MKKMSVVLVFLVLFGVVVFAESSGNTEVTGSSWDNIGPFVEMLSKGRLEIQENFFWNVAETPKTFRVTLERLVDWSNCPNEDDHEEGENRGGLVWARIDPNNNPCGVGGHFLVETTFNGGNFSSRKLLDPLSLGLMFDEEYILFFPGTDYSEWADYYFYKIIDRDSIETKLGLKNLYEINTSTGEAKAIYLDEPIEEPPLPEFDYTEKDFSLKLGEPFSDSYELDGVRKEVKTTIKEINPQGLCIPIGKEEQEGECHWYKTVLALIEITKIDSGETRSKEFVLDEYGGGNREAHFLPENPAPIDQQAEYYIALNKINSDNSIEFSSGKAYRLRPKTESSSPDSEGTQNTSESETAPNNDGQPDGEEKPETTPENNGSQIEEKNQIVEGQAPVKKAGEKTELKILPEQAKQKIKEKENIDCENMELAEKQERLTYTCKTKQQGKLFGIIPMEFEVTAEISAEPEA
ncbi:MAG: hypothetical protein AAB558_04735, partial [Patescibacteria group bacterium]